MGQDHVTTTLQNAIRSGRIAHAYLFYGARGCGKTSTARLLARALNCVATDKPSPEPCGVCRLCVSIRDGSCMDVIEMDAASETGIDDVREKIIENVQYSPTEARYKVYIIDEVHDLSAKAFDALLKTLEEPPAHVIFILATTEHHKVPITIRSRCMPYHFKRGTLQDLAASIERVVVAEGYEAQPEAIQAIARAAEGSWRDALSLLEQVLAYSDGVLTDETVHRALGSVGSDTLFKVTETLARNDWKAALELAGELLESGKDVRQLLTALSGHLRDLMLIAAGAKEAAKQELGNERFQALISHAALYDAPTLLTMMGILSAAEREIRFTNQHRWLLESVLLRLMPANHKSRENEAPTMQRPAADARPTVQRPYQETIASTPTIIPKPPTAPPASAFIQEAEPEQESRVPSEETRSNARPPQTTSVAPPVEIKAAQESPGEYQFPDGVTFEVVQRSWSRILDRFKRASPSGYPFLEKARVVGLEVKTIILSFADEFSRDRIQSNQKGKAKVEQTINETLNVEGMKIRCVLDNEGYGGISTLNKSSDSPITPPMEGMENLPQTPVGADSRAQKAGSGFGDISLPDAEPPANASAKRNPAPAAPVAETTPPAAEFSLVQEAIDLFGGTVVRTEPIT